MTPSRTEPLVTAFCQSSSEQLRAGLVKIDHCLEQLNHDQVWWRPGESMNSIANLLLHLSGNVRQWLIAGISDVTDDRARDQEFCDRSFRSPQDLRARLGETVAEACHVLEGQTAADLLRVRRVQEFEVTGFQAILDSVSHFQGHVQEIIHMTRCQLGGRYKFYFVPADDVSEDAP